MLSCPLHPTSTWRLLLINIFLIFVGMVMETIAAIIILVPVFLPVIETLGIDPLHFGMVVSINLIVGLLTPPVGVALFTTSIVTGTSLQKLVKPIWTWVGIALVVLLDHHLRARCRHVPAQVGLCQVMNGVTLSQQNWTQGGQGFPSAHTETESRSFAGGQRIRFCPPARLDSR